MRTENGLTLDMDAVAQIVEKSDVLTIGFTLFPERLLVDTRSNERDGQFVEMVEPVGNVQERYLWLGRHRGNFGAPEGFAFFVWPHTIRGLAERNVLAPLRARLTPEGNAALDRALEEAAAAETRAIKEMIRGSDAWPAVWQAA